MNTKHIQAAGLALALALSPAAAKAVEVFKSENSSVNVGARMQLQGTLEYSGNSAYQVPITGPLTTKWHNNVTNTANVGNGNRDFTRIFLFQKQNRLKLDANLEGVIVKFENAMGSEATAGGNNLYDLMEFSAEVPVTEGISVVAGLSKMPWNHASAIYEENSLFTDRSELFNLFFNAGSDTTVFAKGDFGLFDGIFGVAQGAGNLAQRYLPETLMFPIPVFTRFGVGTLKEDPARFRQHGFGKAEELQWALHANGFWAADSSAGHGTLFSQMSSQASATKGPFYNGNFLTNKAFNPFAGYTTGGSLSRPDNQLWYASVDTQMRMPMGEGTFVSGAQFTVGQYIAKGMYQAGAPAFKVQSDVVNNNAARKFNYGQVTVQGGELYAGYVGEKWSLAGRVDVLLPDPLLGKVNGGVLTEAWGTDPQWEITFPAITYQLNKYTKFIAESEVSLNAKEVVDTNGVYQLKTVPTTFESYSTQYNPVSTSWVNGKGRLLMQVAF